MNWFRRMMMGRYARLDQLNIALFLFYLFLVVVRFVLGLFFRVSNPVALFQTGFISIGTVYAVLFGLQAAAVVIFILRIFSRNISKRTAENAKFVQKLGFFRDRSAFRQQQNNARRDGKVLFRCPTCKKTVRVPLGRGRIEITCPNCKRKFKKKT